MNYLIGHVDTGSIQLMWEWKQCFVIDIVYQFKMQMKCFVLTLPLQAFFVKAEINCTFQNWRIEVI